MAKVHGRKRGGVAVAKNLDDVIPVRIVPDLKVICKTCWNKQTNAETPTRCKAMGAGYEKYRRG